MKNTKISCLLLILLFTDLYAGTNPAAFLNIGVGARAFGMGGAFTSISDDATATYWNPAGLGKIDEFSVVAMGQSLSSTKWETIKDITAKYQFAGVTIPLKQYKIIGQNSTVGFGWINTGLDDIPHTYLESGKIVRDTFNDLENAYFISYGCSFSSGEDNVFAGTTIKYITQKFSKIEYANASGYDIDMGMIYNWDDLNVGLLLQRGVVLKWDNGHKDTGPLTAKLGISNKFMLTNSFSSLGSIDFIQRQKQPIFANVGTEWGYETKIPEKSLGIKALYIRAGIDGLAIENRYGYRDKINNNINYTVGSGIRIYSWGLQMDIDYAFGWYTLGSKNRFSLNLCY